MLEEAFHSALTRRTSESAFAHQLAVAAAVLQFGGSDGEAARALEADTEGFLTLKEGTEATWRTARQAYLESLRGETSERLLVAACDAHEALGRLLRQLRYDGNATWDAYPVPGMEVGWFFRELLSVLYRGLAEERYRPLLSEIAARIRVLREIVHEGADPSTSLLG